MSLILDQINKDGSHLLVWSDQEELEFFKSHVKLSQNDTLLLDKYKSERRQKDLLISRFLLQKLIPNAQVAYHSSGKPYLRGRPAQISISHSKDLVAVIIHPYKTVGIDIEYISPRVEKLKQRFLSDKEMEDAINREDLTLYWSAKECLFKIDAQQGLDFKTELSLEKKGNNTLLGHIRSSNEITINYTQNKEWLMCYASYEKR